MSAFRICIVLLLLTGLGLLIGYLLRYKTFKAIAKYFLLPLFIIFLVALFLCNRAVTKAAEGKVYSEVNRIPFNEVGLLLGANPTVSHGFFNERIAAAVDLYKGGKIKRLIVSGDSSTNYDEAKAMNEALLVQGVPDSVIFMDKSGHHTRQSIEKCKNVYHYSRVTIISQKFHVVRAIYLASRIGLDAIGYEKGAQWTPPREYLSRIKAVF